MADRDTNCARDLAWGHESHRDFNERLASQSRAAPFRVSREGPWIAAEVVNRLPHVQREFDLNRDPAIRTQVLDLQKTEARRRGEGSAMVGKDRPAPRPVPPKETGRAADREKFREGWLAEQREAAMANVANPKAKGQDRDISRARPRSERSR